MSMSRASFPQITPQRSRNSTQGSKPTGEKDPIKPVASFSMCMMFISTLAMGNKGAGDGQDCYAIKLHFHEKDDSTASVVYQGGHGHSLTKKCMGEGLQRTASPFTISSDMAFGEGALAPNGRRGMQSNLQSPLREKHKDEEI